MRKVVAGGEYLVGFRNELPDILWLIVMIDSRAAELLLDLTDFYDVF